jgi:hypothetical protein
MTEIAQQLERRRRAGEVLPGRESDDFPRLRIDLPLLPGHVVMIDPVYCEPALVNDPDVRERHRDAVDWDRAEPMLGFGGIRIEENVLVTEDGPEVLTGDIPGACARLATARNSQPDPRAPPTRAAPAGRTTSARVAEPLRLGQRLELLQRVVLDLADALARDVERAADLLERERARAGEAEAHLDHLALALG